jgi:hypothetical protein
VRAMHGERTNTTGLMPFETSRRIWSDPTCMLLVFVGASGEFPLNPSVDWLFYTGRLPSDPIARFLSTIEYLRRLIVADEETRKLEANKLKQLHVQLENSRGQQISAKSYRDVLCMDTMYSIRSVPLVTGVELTPAEKDQVVKDLSSVGLQMGISDLPWTYAQLCEQRVERIPSWVTNEFTDRLLKSYRRALGPLVYELLISAYPLMLEPELLDRLGLGKRVLSTPMRWALTPACRTGLIRTLYRVLLPPKIRPVVLKWSKSTKRLH